LIDAHVSEFVGAMACVGNIGRKEGMTEAKTPLPLLILINQ